MASNEMFSQGGYVYKRINGLLQRVEGAEAEAFRRGLSVKTRRSAPRPSISKVTRSYFPKGTRFTNSSGHVLSTYKPLTLRGGKDAINPSFRIKGSNTGKWTLGSSGTKGNKASVLTFQQMAAQLQWAISRIPIQTENFRVVSGQRALQVFRNSFRFHKFDSNGAMKWKRLSKYTIYKRTQLHKSGPIRILREYNDLYNSLTLDTHAENGTVRVYTDIVPADSKKFKKHSICYAGYHNEGEGHYGSVWRKGFMPKKYIQRQFMGHSTKLDPLVDGFMAKTMRLYLFDAVFPNK